MTGWLAVRCREGNGTGSRLCCDFLVEKINRRAVCSYLQLGLLLLLLLSPLNNPSFRLRGIVLLYSLQSPASV